MYDFVEEIENRKKAALQELRGRDKSSLKNNLLEALGAAGSFSAGAAHEIGRLPTGILNAVGYETTNPIGKEDTTAFTLGRIAPPLALGMATAGFGSLLSKAPSIAKYAPALKAFLQSKSIMPAAIKTGLGGAAYEGAADYEDRLGGALTGLAAGTAGGYIGSSAMAIPKIISKGTPNTMAAYILEKLGQGAKDVEENSRRFIQENLRHSAAIQLDKAREAYKEPIDFARKYKVPFNDIIKMFMDSGVKPAELMSGIKSNSKEAFKNLIDNPTLANVHSLQSKLGKNIAENTGSKQIADKRIINEWVDLRDKLKGYISKTLEKESPELASLYSKGSNIWQKDYIPYVESKAAKALLEKRGNQLPLSRKNMHNLFTDPSEQTLKVLEDLGEEGKNRLLFSRFGDLLNSKRPAKELSNAVSELKSAHQSSYSTPAFEKQIDELKNMLYSSYLLKGIGGLGLAGLGYTAHKNLPSNILGF